MPVVRLEDLDYELDPARIAEVPVEPRDSAKLLVDRGSAPPEHRHVRDLPDLLRDGDVLVVNDSKVIPARLALRRQSGGRCEVLLLEPRDPARRWWEALVRPARKLRTGEVLTPDAGGPALVRIGERTPAGDTFEIELLGADEPLILLDQHGRMPLPPYIHTTLERPERYQTVYADEPGSAAAPTAGLHLTGDVLARLANRGIPVVTVELAVGLDTFAPVTEDDPLQHVMHTERYRVPAATWDTVQSAERVVAVGTTSVRALETAAATGKLSGRTALFLHADSPMRVVDVLMTNFHLPRTTLLMMIEALVGRRWRDLYTAALAADYRFLSFGDAMLLDRHAERFDPLRSLRSRR
ncbi:tRNA preQ1(34) S-adenosylmethionine ribosyltransferase-isomerase QueA [soil metagenome]